MKYRHQWVSWAVAIALTQCGQLEEEGGGVKPPEPAPTGTSKPKTKGGTVTKAPVGKGGASGSDSGPSGGKSASGGKNESGGSGADGGTSAGGAPPVGGPEGRPKLPLNPLGGGRFAYNPFVPRANWIRGSGHTHAAPDHSGIAASEQETRLRDLRGAHAHQFVWVTAHSFVAPDPGVPGILHMFGTEVYTAETAGGAWPHLLVYLPGGALADPGGTPFGLRTQTLPELLDSVDEAGGLAAIAHPDRSPLSDTEVARLDHRLFGIEVMSGASDIDENAAFLDRRLSSGVFACATGGGDIHDDAGRMTRGYLVLNVEHAEPSRREVFEATRACNYVVCRVHNTDVVPLEPLSVEIERSVVTVRAQRAGEIRFVGSGGSLLARSGSARAGRYEIRGDEQYVRAEIVADDGRAHCLTQPIWILDDSTQ